MQTFCFEFEVVGRLTLLHERLGRCVDRSLFTGRNLHELLQKLLIVTFDLSLLHRLLILVDPLLVPVVPVLVVLAKLSLFLRFRADVNLATGNARKFLFVDFLRSKLIKQIAIGQ